MVHNSQNKFLRIINVEIKSIKLYKIQKLRYNCDYESVIHDAL